MFINIYLVLMIFFILIVINWKDLIKTFFRLEKRTIAILCCMLVFFLLVYLFFVPNVMRVYGDEPVLVQNSVSYSGELGENITVQSLYHIVFLVFGLSVIGAIKFNIIISIINLLLLFYLLMILFNNKLIALMAPLFLGISQSYIFSATSAYTVIISLMFLLLSSIFFWLFIKDDKYLINLLFTISLCILAVARFEYIIVIPLFFFWWLILKKHRLNFRKKNVYYWLRNITAWVLIIPFLLIDYMPILAMKLGHWDLDQTVSFTAYNLPVTFLEFIPDHLSWIIFIIFCLMFTGYWLKKQNKILQGLFMLSVSVVFTIFYCMNSYFARWYYLPVNTFSFFIIATPFTFVKFKNKFLKISLLFVISSILIFFFFSSIKGLDDTKVTFDYTYTSTVAPQIIKPYLPKDSTIITTYSANLGMGLYNKVISTDEFIDDLSSYRQIDDLYFFEDHLCFIDFELYGRNCELIKKNFHLVPIVVIKSQRNIYVYTLYKLYFNDTLNKSLEKPKKEPEMIILS